MSRKLVKRASEILADALQLWGSDGERWCQQDLSIDGSYCLVGGLSKAALGVAAYADPESGGSFIDIGLQVDKEQMDELIQAERLVYEQLPNKQDYMDNADILCYRTVEEGIVNFNDSEAHSFDDVKNVVCSAIKVAVQREAGEEEVSAPTCRRDPVTGMVTCD